MPQRSFAGFAAQDDSRGQVYLLSFTRMTRTALLLLFFALPALAGEHPGAALYRGKGACAICHGNDGSGNTPTGKSMKAPDLRTAAVQKKDDATLTAVIRNGKGRMPSMKNALAPQEIATVVGYLRTLK